MSHVRLGGPSYNYSPSPQALMPHTPAKSSKKFGKPAAKALPLLSNRQAASRQPAPSKANAIACAHSVSTLVATKWTVYV